MAHVTDRSIEPAALAVAAEERGFESVFGAARVVVGVSGDRDQVLRQLDHHRPLIQQFEEQS